MDKCQIKDTVVIRQAQYPKDINSLVEMVEEYAHTGEIPINIEVTRNSLIDMINQGNVFVGSRNNADIGAVAGYEFNFLFSGEPTFCVMFMFMKGQQGSFTREFLKELELCLMATKFKTLTIGIPSHEFDEDGPKLERFFQILGYKPLEKHFYKRLCQ